MRLIDADALIKWLTSPTGFHAACEDCQSFGSECVKCIIAEAIENAPTIDPVKHGYWIDNGTHDTCSICGESFGKYDEYDYRQDFDFCPMCGSKMDGVIQCG